MNEQKPQTFTGSKTYVGRYERKKLSKMNKNCLVIQVQVLNAYPLKA